MKVKIEKKDGVGKRVEEKKVDSNVFEINYGNFCKIKIVKKNIHIQISDDYTIQQKFSVKIGGKYFTGSKYEVLSELLRKKVKDLNPTAIDTLYYNTPSEIMVINDVFDKNNIMVCTIAYVINGDELQVTIKFYSGHIVREIDTYYVTTVTKHLE